MINKMSTKQVFAASLLQLSESHSMQNISVTMICQNCELSSRTFYNHFKDKDDLVFWIYRDYWDALLTRVCDAYNWKDAVVEALIYIKKHKSFFKNAFLNTVGHTSFISMVTRNSYESACKVIQKHTDAWPLSKTIEFQLRLYFYGVASMACDWCKSQMDIDPETFGNLLIASMPADVKKLLMDPDEKQL